MTPLSSRIARLRTRIQRACEDCGRDPGGVELLPVSKRQPLNLVREAAALGFPRFGENYVQEALAKISEAPDLGFVLIGPLQRNKARTALLNFRQIMTVDRPELALRLRHLAGELDVTREIWLQVDLWDETTKVGGAGAGDLEAVFAALGDDPRLPVQGFMAIPPPEDPGSFRALDLLRTRWQEKLGRKLRLSMGMSGDLEEAIRAGSDQVRIGTAFFGTR
ncbi:YggS family pyridoxal phosphate-dependent enzyme [Mesoterricola silvestris]|uniref:Pyridoxal phosphate homeostasis protein n=1 Tax=Mesoterricola silvestris TaxID=2927979 RepID=A0AA48GKX0_9BACT|nr:YggS family pyridoxal phosphate-dependent enzyme [Mesoterricola silvestris]BDU73104.1 YggS family pyridoxal phosphate enzyme [Mesoterricola silvestris]